MNAAKVASIVATMQDDPRMEALRVVARGVRRLRRRGVPQRAAERFMRGSLNARNMSEHDENAAARRRYVLQGRGQRFLASGDETIEGLLNRCGIPPGEREHLVLYTVVE